MKIPKKIGKYNVQALIGKGSMGLVYSGYDPFRDKPVAIKIARSIDATDERRKQHMRKMFFNEAKAAGSLNHPNILHLIDAGINDDICYLVTELIAGGKTLKEYCKPENLLSYSQIAEIIFRCAKALDYAHRTGVIHRDIKPTNILVTTEMDIRIADFSIASMMNPDMEQTVSGRFMGSPRYMSPEQAQEEIVTNQTDLFSLGVVSYELITGHHPFQADNFSSLIHKILNEKPPPMQEYRSDVPKVLRRIVKHAMEKSLRNRYSVGLNMAADLSVAFDFLVNSDQSLTEKERFNQLKALDFFRDFNASELWEIVRVAVFEEVDEGVMIIAEGKEEDWIYLLAMGSVDIIKDDVCVGSLGVGDCFGEMAFLSKERRSANIVAKTKVTAVKLNATAMARVSKSCNLKFSTVFIRILTQRLSDTTRKYADAIKH